MVKQISVLIVGLCLWVTGSVVHAADTARNQTSRAQANEQIDLAGRQRMLSQRMAAASCLAMVGADVANRRAITRASWEEFDNFLVAIRHGDTEHGWSAAEDKEVLAAIDQVERIWSETKLSILQIAAGDLQLDIVRTYMAGSAPLLKRSDDLVKALSGAFGGSVISAEQAETIDIAGRQRMLSQRMMKNACMFAVGLQREKAGDMLETHIALFDESLQKLSTGDTEAGIIEPPTRALSTQLAAIDQLWRAYQGELEELMAAPALDTEQLSNLAMQSDVLLGEMDKAVKMYVAE